MQYPVAPRRVAFRPIDRPRLSDSLYDLEGVGLEVLRRGYGGGPWIETGLRRPDEGWDGYPIIWMGSSGRDLERDNGEYELIVACGGCGDCRIGAGRAERRQLHRTGCVSSRRRHRPCVR